MFRPGEPALALHRGACPRRPRFGATPVSTSFLAAQPAIAGANVPAGFRPWWLSCFLRARRSSRPKPDIPVTRAKVAGRPADADTADQAARALRASFADDPHDPPIPPTGLDPFPEARHE
jgi:hypothetical protein